MINNEIDLSGENSQICQTATHTETGMLYICATPIGNLEDITLRVIRILGEVDVVAAEDTRRTLKLLNHLELKKQLISCHEHNERERAQEIMNLLSEGKKVAYVSDAGMPGISDPGSELVSACIKAGYPFTVLPGASAVLCALVLSGLPTDRFTFEGFLPRVKKQRREVISLLAHEQRTIVIYESPYRLCDTLKELSEELGPRRAAVVRELTKLHEEAVRDTLPGLAEFYHKNMVKGECILVIEGAFPDDHAKPESDIEGLLLSIIKSGVSRKDAIRIVSEQSGIAKNKIYNLVNKIT